jgi:hypothetical protein
MLYNYGKTMEDALCSVENVVLRTCRQYLIHMAVLSAEAAL